MLKLCPVHSDETPPVGAREPAFDCAKARAVLQIGPDALTDGALQSLAAHLDECSDCGAAFDVLVPPDTGSPLRNAAQSSSSEVTP